jgi:hypothetical protein
MANKKKVGYPFHYVSGLQLTEGQRHRYETVEWLLDRKSNIGTGRTTLMALAFINIAIKNLGKPVKVFDHTGEELFNHRMIAEILRLIRTDQTLRKVLHVDAHISDNSIVIRTNYKKSKP